MSQTNNTAEIVKQWRAILEGKKRALFESENTDNGAIPYGQNEEIVTEIIDTATSEFGAKFDKYKNPVVYIPSTEDVVVNGDIPSLGANAKFEFHYRPEHAGEECILHTDTLVLNDDILSKLNKIWGVYKNWKGRTLDAMQDIKPMGMRDAGLQNQRQIVPGDDLD